MFGSEVILLQSASLEQLRKEPGHWATWRQAMSSDASRNSSCRNLLLWSVLRVAKRIRSNPQQHCAWKTKHERPHLTNQRSTMAARLEDVGDGWSTARHSSQQQSPAELNTQVNPVSSCRSVISQVGRCLQISHGRKSRFVAVLMSGLRIAANRVLEKVLTAGGFTNNFAVTGRDLL